VERIYEKSDTSNWVEGAGLVKKLLPDDNNPSRHQRFILDMRNGQTLLIAHNLNLATKVPVGLGDRIRFRGMYEWNELGGLVHWTHADPLRADEGGYIKYRTKVYE
jgi:hypothetical protein